jgi:predicted glycosyltransferase
MNILIDIGHPAHIHLFRNAASNWIKKGHDVIFTIRDRNIIPVLMKSYGFEYFIASKAKSTSLGLLYELVEHDLNVLKIAKKMKSDLLLGTSVSITHVSKLLGNHSIVFNEDDEDYLNSFRFLAYPFADTIVIPNSLRDRITHKHVTYNSYHELAYLHPNHFVPDTAILSELGVEANERYFIVRLVSLSAHHDKGHAGISEDTRRKIIKLLSQYGRVFITAEGSLPDDLACYKLPITYDRIHHALSFASMLVSDSQTMTIEAAVLGTPAIRYNTFVGLCSVIEELEKKYELTYGFLPEQENEMLGKIQDLLKDLSLKETWARKRQKMLSEKIDLAYWMEKFIEGYPENLNKEP